MDFSVVILFSSLDDPFIDKCIDGVLPSANKVVLVSYDKLFNGTPDIDGVNKIIERNKHKDVVFHTEPHPAHLNFDHPKYYLTHIRKIGWELVRDTADYTLFLDGDEVAEPEKLLEWKSKTKTNAGTILMPSYYYFREPIYRRKKLGYTSRMARNTDIIDMLQKNPKALDRHTYDRRIYAFNPRRIAKTICIHHYAWAKPKEQIIKKVSNWGHSLERDWPKIVHEEYSRPFNGKDFISGDEYETVENYFDIEI